MQELPNAKMIFKLIIRKLIYLGTFHQIKLKRPLRYNEMLLSFPTEEKFYAEAKNILKVF